MPHNWLPAHHYRWKLGSRLLHGVSVFQILSACDAGSVCVRDSCCPAVSSLSSAESSFSADCSFSTASSLDFTLASDDSAEVVSSSTVNDLSKSSESSSSVSGVNFHLVLAKYIAQIPPFFVQYL